MGLADFIRPRPGVRPSQRTTPAPGGQASAYEPGYNDHSTRRNWEALLASLGGAPGAFGGYLLAKDNAANAQQAAGLEQMRRRQALIGAMGENGRLDARKYVDGANALGLDVSLDDIERLQQLGGLQTGNAPADQPRAGSRPPTSLPGALAPGASSFEAAAPRGVGDRVRDLRAGDFGPSPSGLAGAAGQMMVGLSPASPMGSSQRRPSPLFRTAALTQSGPMAARDPRPVSVKLADAPWPSGGRGGPAQFQMAAYVSPRDLDEGRGTPAAAEHAAPAAAGARPTKLGRSGPVSSGRRRSAASGTDKAIPLSPEERNAYADIVASQITAVTGPEFKQPIKQAIAQDMRIRELSPEDKLNAVRAAQIYQAARAAGGDPLDAVVAANVESQMHPEVQYGLYQFKWPTWVELGGDPAREHDLNAQVTMYATKTSPERRAHAETVLGRKSEGWENYVFHQQGDGGGAALFKMAKTAPDTPASAVLAPVWRKKGETPEHAQGRVRLELRRNGLGRDPTVAEVLGALKALYERRRGEALHYLQLSGITGADTATGPSGQGHPPSIQ
jgi:hypothetical protein